MNLTQIVNGIQPVDRKWIEKAQERTAQLVMPTRALGRLHDISERLCGIQKSLQPSTDRKAIVVMAGDHGVVEEGVSAYPQEVTGAMIQTFLAGGAGINAICRHVKAEVFVVDMGTTADFDGGNMPDSDRLVYIGMNNYDAGRMCGKLVKEAMPEGGEVMIFVGRLGQLNADLRRQGVIDELLDRDHNPNRKYDPQREPQIGSSAK